MLTIREEQMEELAKVSLKRFEDSMVEHVKEFFPGYYEVLGEPTIRRVVQYGVDRAETHDFITERNVCLYINLMFLLGSNFDEDLQLPWAASILAEESTTEPNTRIDELVSASTEYLDEIAGVDDQHIARALVNIREVSIEDFSQSSTGNVGREIIALLQKVWPQKCGRLGDAILRQLIGHGVESMAQYNVTSDRGVALYTGLTFMLGSGLDSDPQFPWAATVLNDESIPDQATRVDRLYKESMAFLDKWLAR